MKLYGIFVNKLFIRAYTDKMVAHWWAERLYKGTCVENCVTVKAFEEVNP